MKAITLLQPQKIVFGTGCIQTLVEDYKKMGLQRLFVLTAPPIRPMIEESLGDLKAAGVGIDDEYTDGARFVFIIRGDKMG